MVPLVPCVVPLVRTVGGPDLIEEAGPPLLSKIQGADRAHPDQETKMPPIHQSGNAGGTKVVSRIYMP